MDSGKTVTSRFDSTGIAWTYAYDTSYYLWAHTLSILENGDLVGGFYENGPWRVLWHNKNTGAIEAYMNHGTTLQTTSSFGNNYLAGGDISGLTHLWAVYDETNTPIVKCSISLP